MHTVDHREEKTEKVLRVEECTRSKPRDGDETRFWLLVTQLQAG